MIEGSGYIPLTNGSGSRRPKNMWIWWIRIRNTSHEELLAFIEGIQKYEICSIRFLGSPFETVSSSSDVNACRKESAERSAKPAELTVSFTAADSVTAGYAPLPPRARLHTPLLSRHSQVWYPFLKEVQDSAQILFIFSLGYQWLHFWSVGTVCVNNLLRFRFWLWKIFGFGSGSTTVRNRV